MQVTSIGSAFLAAAIFLIEPVAAEESSPPRLDEYVAVLAATMNGAATADEFQALLGFYADEIVYEHPAVGIRLEGKEAQQTGLEAFRSTYAGGADDSTFEILDFVKGKDMAAIRGRASFLLAGEDGPRRVTRTSTRVFEFKGGKITRIIDYW